MFFSPTVLSKMKGDFGLIFEQLYRTCENYNAGTKVLQPKTGHVYQCRPWPFNEFCRASDDKKFMFEPGVGQSWAMAWQQI